MLPRTADALTPRDFYYQDAAIVDAYATHEGFLPGEEGLAERYITPATRLLDVGIGAGRTTALLAPRVRAYVGIDYADLMVRRARERFPGLELTVDDAADLSRFRASSFDVVLFSFNGLGVLPTDEHRRRCLREVARVLVPGGVFLFSLHNARCLAYAPSYAGAGALRRAWRTVYAGVETLRQVAARLPSATFWRGAGFVRDPLQPRSPTIYACRPEDVAREAAQAGLDLEEVVGFRRASLRDALLVPHIYYACRKRSAKLGA